MNHIDQRESGFFQRESGTSGQLRSLPGRLRSKLSALKDAGQPVAELARLVELAREDLEAHDGDWSRPGFQALLVHRFGTWRMSIRSKLLRAPFSICSRTLFAAVRNFYGIELPVSASIGRRVVFEHQHGIVVHGNSVIGDDCIIRQGVTLGIRRMDRLTEAPVLGRGVNVGAGAKILGRVFIGDGADIGANAVVLEDVPAQALAVGIPAKSILRNNSAKGQRERPMRAVTELPGAPRSAPANSNMADGVDGIDANLCDGTNGAPPPSKRANSMSANGSAASRAHLSVARNRPN
ncbi:MAG TPA: serine O-acetyltransferase [Polyangiaceae bacterium]|nr:serine O-acetyltransferase [Polyangiaceae bacterium]